MAGGTRIAPTDRIKPNSVYTTEDAIKTIFMYGRLQFEAISSGTSPKIEIQNNNKI